MREKKNHIHIFNANYVYPPHIYVSVFFSSSVLQNSYHVYIDENGDAAGNYTILALKRDHRQDSNLSMAYGLYPIGTFGLPDSNQIPVSSIFVFIFDT